MLGISRKRKGDQKRPSLQSVVPPYVQALLNHSRGVEISHIGQIRNLFPRDFKVLFTDSSSTDEFLISRADPMIFALNLHIPPLSLTF